MDKLGDLVESLKTITGRAENEIGAHWLKQVVIKDLSMKTISKQEIRRKVVGNVLASLRIEKLQPSAEVAHGLNACMAGQETTANLHQQVMKRHVSLRRG